MSALPLAIPGEFLKEFCERNHIRKLSLFGSVLTPHFRPESDVDMLVKFDPGHIPGLLTLAGMEIELSEKLGRQVDLRTAEDLSRYFRAEVVSSAIPQYERP
jgi:predicted nucleotidyltransferase